MTQDPRLPFIEHIKDGAIKGWKTNKVLPSISIAQGILESATGQSELAVNANNLFGIKGEYNGESYSVITWEHIDGEDIIVTDDFRKYPSWNESVEDHSKFFTSTPWRADNYAKIVGETDYKVVAQELSNAGYATDPNYPSKLIDIIEQYNLTQYDEIAFEQDDDTKYVKSNPDLATNEALVNGKVIRFDEK